MAGAQNVAGRSRCIASSIPRGVNFSVSYTPTAAPQIHWPYILPQANFAQPESVCVRCTVPSSTQCQYLAVTMCPSGRLWLWSTILGMPVVPEEK